MAKVTIDVEELKKNLVSKAMVAKDQISEIAKKAQADFNQGEVRKKVEQALEYVKTQPIMKNPKVVELTTKLADISDQVTKNAAQIVDSLNSNTKKAKPKAAPKKKAAAPKKAPAKKAPAAKADV